MNFYVSILSNIALKIVASKIKCVATDRLLPSYTGSFIVIFLFGYLHFVFFANLFFSVPYIDAVILWSIKTNLLLHEQGNTLQEEPT